MASPAKIAQPIPNKIAALAATARMDLFRCIHFCVRYPTLVGRAEMVIFAACASKSAISASTVLYRRPGSLRMAINTMLSRSPRNLRRNLSLMPCGVVFWPSSPVLCVSPIATVKFAHALLGRGGSVSHTLRRISSNGKLVKSNGNCSVSVSYKITPSE